MRDITDLFTVDGQGILVPDAPVTVQLTDIEGESARDRSGMLHRTVLRRVRSWEFTYGRLTEEERSYMQTLLMGEAAFRFVCPDGECLCCCRGWRMDYYDATQGQWQNFRFLVEEV